MKSFCQYLAKLDRSATAQIHQIGRKKLYRAILATTFIAGSQILGAIAATANPVPTPAQPSPLLPTRFILNGNFEDTQVKEWVGPFSSAYSWASKDDLKYNSWNEYHLTAGLANYNDRNPDPNGLRYASKTSFSSTLGQAGNNIATANVRQGYNETKVNPAAKPVIWLTSETGEFRSLWNYSDAIEIFRGNCSQFSPQDHITTPSRSDYNPCGEKSAPVPLISSNSVNGTPLPNDETLLNGATSPNGTADSATNQFAEIQGSALATLYQDIYVFSGETVGWSLRHAARNTPDDWGNLAAKRSDKTNIMQVSITDPDPNYLPTEQKWDDVTPPVSQTNAYYSSIGDFSSTGTYPAIKKTTSTDPITANRPFISTSVSQGWKRYKGRWTAATNPTPKLMRFGFKAIQGSGGITTGNFIDDVVIDLKASADFLPTDAARNVNLATHTEGNTANNYYLSLRMNGKTTGGTITIRMAGLNQPSGSTARTFTVGTVLKGAAGISGLTATNNGDNTITLAVPAGTYNPNLAADYIHIPLDFSNTATQPNNTLVFSFFTATGNLMIQPQDTNINGMGRISVETQLIDDDYQKRVELPVARPVRIAAK